jgi:hypothetical protein
MRAATWALLLLVTTAAGPAQAETKKGPRREARTCVRLSEAELASGDLELKLDNTCDAARECTIRWTLTCQGQKPQRAEFVSYLLAGTDEKWTVPISSCGDAAYRVSAPTFVCRSPKVSDEPSPDDASP